MIATLAREAFEAFRDSDVEWFIPRLAPSLAGMLDSERLRAAFASSTTMFGRPLSAAEPVLLGGPQSKQVTVDVHGERMDSVLIISFDDQNRISGFNMIPRAEHPAPSYAANNLDERSVTLAADPNFPLEGTLTLPARKSAVPGVVCVHGSGPNDRDETVFGAKPFLDLALGFGAQGIAVLRYDKRTRVHGARVAANVRAEVIDDAAAAIDLLAATDEIASVFVLGHSLGGTLAPAIACFRPSIAGVILLAGATRPTAEIVREQVEHLLADGEQSAGQRKPLERLLASLDGDLLGLPSAYWDSLDANGPEVFGPRLTVPVLALQGERDYQVTMSDFDGWRRLLAGNPRATFVSYPELNHLFAPGEGTSTPAEYMQPSNVDERVIAAIGEWVLTNSK